MLRHAKDASISKGDDFWSDLQDGFRQAGFSTAEIKDAIWNVIGVISTAGASLGGRLGPLERPPSKDPLVVGLVLMGEIMPYLDLVKFEKHGALYSYPREVNISCDNGKPYHFWMTAFLSRKLTLQNGDSKAAAMAAFLAEKGYQTNSDLGGRGLMKVLALGEFDPASNIIRSDLSYAAAGAMYGAETAKGIPSNLDVDEGIRVLLRNTTAMSPMEKGDAQQATVGLGVQGYLRWQRMFHPDTVFDYFLNRSQEK
jgi:hypothetical protein